MNNIILDTDPGIDDAVAIAVLMKEKKEQVKLILSSYGNISADAAARNTLTMLSLLDIDDIPVLRSSLCPLSGKWEEAKHIHGEDGLGGLSLASEIPTDKIITDDFIKITYEKIIECGKVDYITLGRSQTWRGL